MSDYATAIDVAKRLGRELTEDEAARVPGLLEEATALVDGYCGQVFAVVPVGVRVATSKVVARALPGDDDDDMGGPAVSSEQFTAGSFTLNRSYSGDGANVWLGAAEKAMLRPYRVSATSVAMVSDRGTDAP
ncbi:hypothetical protein CH253_08135 [Rhodococcus sp. 06-156-3C]|uniref:hypothetical protein n=1 Tax=Rhodococcus sp. 06-156-3C TaxID=2022486 RepID=UPI000B9A2A56|nr:hypothetical protein [Rhodococcus sp. 06-156-3C]OZD23821.1 hypothetical protein CH253_08135 [Rhodococcus sp. 06-156-3C]